MRASGTFAPFCRRTTAALRTWCRRSRHDMARTIEPANLVIRSSELPGAPDSSEPGDYEPQREPAPWSGRGGDFGEPRWRTGGLPARWQPASGWGVALAVARGPYARQWLAVKRTSTGMISSRPRYISDVSTTVLTLLNGSNEPIGPAKPRPGPTPPSIEAESARAWNAVRSTLWSAESRRIATAPAAQT